jgi:hypothetical protein
MEQNNVKKSTGVVDCDGNVGVRSIVVRIVLLSLKQNVCGHKVEDDCEVQTVVTGLLIRQDMYLYEYGAENVFKRYDKCLIFDGECVDE